MSFDRELEKWMAFGTQEMWTSSDGTIWERQAFQGEDLGPGSPDPLPPRMVDAVRMGDRFWAAGTWDNDSDGLALLMWSSVDGATWSVVPLGGFVGYSAHAITTNGSTLAIANTHYAQGLGDVISSSSGDGWTSHTAGLPAAMLDIYGDADGFAAVGYRLDGRRYVPAIWTSANGDAWLDASPESGTGRLRSIVRASDGGYLAAGVDLDGAIRIWRSTNGRDWAESRVPSPGVADGAVWPELGLVAADSRIILVARTVIGWWFWTSNDGQSWSRGSAIGAVGSSSFGPFVAMSGDRVVAFLDEGPPDDARAHVMVGKVIPVE